MEPAMITESGRVILNYDDYAALPEDGRRWELFEGEIDMAPAPNVPHQAIVLNLALLLAAHVRARRLGRLLIAPCDVVLSNVTVLQPDLLFVAREHESIITHPNVQGAPDLVIEVTSPASISRDNEIKRQLYTKYAVANYWLFDPARRQAIALSLESGTYRQVTVARRNETFSAPPFMDLAIALAEVWE